MFSKGGINHIVCTHARSFRCVFFPPIFGCHSVAQNNQRSVFIAARHRGSETHSHLIRLRPILCPDCCLPAHLRLPRRWLRDPVPFIFFAVPRRLRRQSRRCQEFCACASESVKRSEAAINAGNAGNYCGPGVPGSYCHTSRWHIRTPRLQLPLQRRLRCSRAIQIRTALVSALG